MPTSSGPGALRVVADENIPCVQEAFGQLGPVELRAGHEIDAATVREADVLLVRSVTDVGAKLLAGSTVQFVGSATIGTDHVDQAYLAEQNIAFAHAPGSNADSVADYVVTALLTLARRKRVRLAGQTVGIVGCGNIGGRLARRLPALGLDVLCNDPPRAETEASDGAHPFHSLPTVLDAADILTLHVPLTTDGPHRTHRLIGEEELRRLRREAWLLNTSRGEVLAPEALREAMDEGQLGGLVLDVWPNEPVPDPELLRAADIATPHIAGYAYDGKVRGTVMLHRALCAHLGVEASWDPEAVLQPETPERLQCVPPDPNVPPTDALHRLARQGYDLMRDDARLRATLNQPEGERGAAFSRLRKTYPRRYEFQRHRVPRFSVPDALRSAVTDGLTMRLG